MDISYAILLHDEWDEFSTLVNKIDDLLDLGGSDSNDEIVVVWDKPEDDNKVSAIQENLNDLDLQISFNVYEKELKGHFGKQKNYANKCCINEYIFNIDADEMPHEFLLKNLKSVIQHNKDKSKDFDLYRVPRVNTVENITQFYINKWGWYVNDKGWINWPDYQSRIYKNKRSICWKGKVHERIVGYDKYTELPKEERFALYHHKKLDKQRKQNELYQKMIYQNED